MIDDPEHLAGPDSFGRSLVIDTDDTSAQDVIPKPWRSAPIIEADAGAAPAIVDRLEQAWRKRERLVIQWSGPLPESDPVLSIPYYELAPGTELPGERLGFFLTTNAVVAVADTVRFEPIERAVALGAKPATDNTSSGDVVLPDGELGWVDGGPSSLPLTDHDSIGIVPRAHLVTGSIKALSPEPPKPTADLAPDQLAAVAHAGGPARIIAPAGSGKTRVLTERTRHLIADRGFDPSAVVLVAYNRRAKAEMADRLSDVRGIRIQTLNALARSIAVGDAPFAAPAQDRGNKTINEMDARRLLERLVPKKRRRSLTDPLEAWVDALSASRLGLRSPRDIESAYGADVAGFAEVVSLYRAELADRRWLDFDEQILAAIEILLTDPKARAAARAVAPILLVDEFQDLTPAHLLLVRLLAGPGSEVFAVGDDDQTIYGYSGASPDWLVNFDQFFPGAADHRLTINYRCPPTVVKAAHNLLTHNDHRVHKVIESAPGREAEANELTIAGGPDPHRRLSDHVLSLLDAGNKPADIAILARVNAALLPPLIHLAEAGIPVAKPPGVDTHMLDRSGTGAALAWLRLAVAPAQRLSTSDLRQAIKRPPRSLHPRIVDWVCEQSSVKDLRALSHRLNTERDSATVAELADDIEALRSDAKRGAGAAELLDAVYSDIGLGGAVTKLDSSQRTARRAAHADELAALRAVAELCHEPGRLGVWLRERLEALPSFHSVAEADGPKPVTLATIHSTKGLEWPHVVVHDVRDGLFPHSLADDISEERRIFHVAITRGRSSVLVNAGPAAKGPDVSPFLRELTKARSPEAIKRATRLAEQEKQNANRGPSSGLGLKPKSGPSSKADSEKRERHEPATPDEAARRQALTEWRTARSKADGVPAFIVMGNQTLDAIAAEGPTTERMLGQIKGIGPAKIERYGKEILRAVERVTASD